MRARYKARLTHASLGVALLAAAFLQPLMPHGNALAATAGLERIDVFAQPLARQTQVTAERLLQAGRNKQALQVLEPLLARYPDLSLAQYLMAVAASRDGDMEKALAALEGAVEAGFSNLVALRTEKSLQSLQGNGRFTSVLGKAEQNAAQPQQNKEPAAVVPAIVRGGKATVEAGNTVVDRNTNLLFSTFRFNSKLLAPPNAYQGKDQAVDKVLNDLVRRGFAAGNAGDLYDNRDRGHSVLFAKHYPQLSYIEYAPEAERANADFSFNSQIIFGAPTIGNASLGVYGHGSIARISLRQPRNAAVLHLQYRSNQLYAYPSVKDFLADGVDAFPANTPYMLVSQGMSSSDMALVGAAANIMAALKPDVKEYLIDQKLLMPTLQMVFRMGQKAVSTPEDYLTAVAHPTVFTSGGLDLLKMVQLANSLEIQDIPPLVQLKVVGESQNKRPPAAKGPVELQGADFTTPSAIARTVVKEDGVKRMVISAAGTWAPNGQKPTFEWVVLEGDKDRVTITPRNKAGSAAEIIVDWHGRRASAAVPGMRTDRVDIGVFAKAGEHFSAPAFISVYNQPQDLTHPSTAKPAQN